MIPPLPFTSDLSVKPDVTGFFDKTTNTITYVVADPATKACAVFDPVMDLDYAAGRLSSEGADRIIAHIRQRGWTLEWVIETHAHADHLTAAPHIIGALGGRLGIGRNITIVQEIFGDIFNEGPDFKRDGSQFDRLFADGDSYTIGGMTAHAMDVSGHTPACMAHIVGDAVFVADTLFMPDGGTARADFRGGSARTLYRSIRRILSLPPEMRVFVLHDYQPNGREVRWETTVAEQRETNIHIHDGVGEDAFVEMREARDRTLPMPKLILPSLQVNMRAGQLPPADQDGKRFLKVPLNTL